MEQEPTDLKSSSPAAVAGKIELPKDEGAPKVDAPAQNVDAVKEESVPKPEVAANQNISDKQELPPPPNAAPKVEEAVKSEQKQEEAPAEKDETPSKKEETPAKQVSVEEPKVAAPPLAVNSPAAAPSLDDTEVDKKNEATDTDAAPGNPFPHEGDSEEDSYGPDSFKQSQENLCKDSTMPLVRETINNVHYYSFNFSMMVATPSDEGLYNLYFHACPNYHTSKIMSFNVSTSNYSTWILSNGPDLYLGGHRGEQQWQLFVGWRNAPASLVLHDEPALLSLRPLLGFHFEEEQVS